MQLTTQMAPVAPLQLPLAPSGVLLFLEMSRRSGSDDGEAGDGRRCNSAAVVDATTSATLAAKRKDSKDDVSMRTASAAAADATTSASVRGGRRCNYECDAGGGRRCNYECDAGGDEGFLTEDDFSTLVNSCRIWCWTTGTVWKWHASMYIHLCQREGVQVLMPQLQVCLSHPSYKVFSATSFSKAF